MTTDTHTITAAQMEELANEIRVAMIRSYEAGYRTARFISAHEDCVADAASARDAARDADERARSRMWGMFYGMTRTAEEA